MLNRTNRTLSARTNRLNLGTRMLDQNTSANNGSLTLRTAHVDHVVITVRVGHFVDSGCRFEVQPIRGLKPVKSAKSAMSGSSPVSSWPSSGRSIRDQQGQPVALAMPPVGLIVALPDDYEAEGGMSPPLASPILRRWRSPSDLLRRCDRPRRAGRSARATQVPLAAS